ncbi:membrane protein [Streptococcus pseudoporcinus]|nr:membrane protein [Streptococcus pseudoporcinus]
MLVEEKHVMNNHAILDIQPQKSQKRLKVLSFLLLIFLVLGTGAFAYYKYHKGSLEGTWKANSVKGVTDKEFGNELKLFDKQLGIPVEKSISEPQLKMTVKEDKVEMAYYITVKRDLLSQQVLDYYNREMDKILKDSSLSLGELDPEAKAAIEQSIPTKTDIQRQLDERFMKSAYAMNGAYDKATGVISSQVASGKVNRFLNRVEFKSLNKKAKIFMSRGKNVSLKYSNTNQKVVLTNQKDKMVFTK